jgi:hypothetical protein
MFRQTLKDASHRIIGHIDTASGGRQTARNAQYQTVGYYDPHTGITRDHRFHTVGHGNLLASLIAGR